MRGVASAAAADDRRRKGDVVLQEQLQAIKRRRRRVVKSSTMSIPRKAKLNFTFEIPALSMVYSSRAGLRVSRPSLETIKARYRAC